jgi:electron transport complex protein RnfC
MSILASKGCLHIEGHKELTKELGVEVVTAPSVIGKIYVPITGANGKPMTLLVNEGDEVKINTKLGVAPGFDVPYYSSVSGKIVGQETRFNAVVGRPVPHLVIENDFKDERVSLPVVDVENATKEELVNALKEAGLVGLGGSGFPTYVKYQKDAELILINGCECEPYLTTDQVVSPTKTDLLVKGIKILMKAANANKAMVAIKKGKPHLHEALVAAFENEENIDVVEVADVYPVGWERVLIRKVLRKEYDRLPNEVGVTVNNIQTAIAAADALLNGNAVTRKTITVSGNAVARVGNFEVPVGTVAGSLIEYLGGYTEENVILLAGGPMTSKGQMNDKFIVERQTGGLTVLKHVEVKSEACLRCGACTNHCPAGLQPVEIKRAVEAKDVDRMIALNADRCIECGLCSFVCPSKIDVTEAMKKAKLQLRIAAMKKK